MDRNTTLLSAFLVGLTAVMAAPTFADEAAFRPPAVPLVTHDPYFSVWSFNDRLTDGWPRHWTGSNQGLCGLIRIDGQAYRYMGPNPRETPVMKQTRLQVFPTRTIYEFEAGGVRATLTFITPALPSDMDLASWPVTFLDWSVVSLDGKSHEVSIYLDCCAELCVDRTNQRVMPSRLRGEGLTMLRFGTTNQPMLDRAGDDLRIDWGFFTLAIPRKTPHSADATQPAEAIVSNDVITSHTAAREGFAKLGQLPAGDELRFPRPVNDGWPVLACQFDLGQVGAEAVSRHVLLAYDDQYGIEYFQRKLRPYWRRAGMEFDVLLRSAEQQYPALRQRCEAFDEELIADLKTVGGPKYAEIATLAFRQTLAAHKLAADFDGTPLMFPKENFSNGCISTVDVFYPSAPFFLLFNPHMLTAQMMPILEYARTPRWPHPFAPHDLGTYPQANGQVYGGGEVSADSQMPVEESANMIILLGALAKLDGKGALAQRYAAQAKKWAEYLDDKGYDPENQLCTDDFAGHLAHNTNLSIKAIVALGAYAKTCEAAHQAEAAKTWREIAENMAQRWVKDAADGDHTRLAFDKPGTWSQKYNLVWDRVLDLKLFPPELARSEAAFYLTKRNKYGLPLDNRAAYTKLDWCLWTGALTGERAHFDAIVSPVHAFVVETPSRVPLTDWFSTVDAKQVGFQARSVVGGVFMPMIADPAMWEKWSKRAK